MITILNNNQTSKKLHNLLVLILAITMFSCNDSLEVLITPEVSPPPPPPDPITVKSTFTATGTPKFLQTPGDRTWTGIFEPVEEGGVKKYKITNWGNDNITIHCDVKDGKIVIDHNTRVTYNNTYDGYFRVGYIEGGTLYLLLDYSVTYHASTKTLDFTGTVNAGGKQYEALVGVAAFDKTTGNAGGVFTDFYAGAKLQLTPIMSSAGATVRPSDGTDIFHST
ncbi:MAG: hypothetical protein LBE79_10730, partial [Tannerella sp.]|nr:hypothetical protein [Tannerella sp.]